MTSALRIERESVLRCDHCGANPYVVYRRQVRRRDGSPGEAFDNVLWPNGSGIPPPSDPEHMCCPECREELRRVTG